jgi:phosphate uptake regulator
MDLRKVQRTNSGTFFITLPKHWAKQVGVNKGTLLGVTESKDGRLFLNPKYDVEKTPQIAIIIRPTRYLSREIVEKYLLGYDEIRVEKKTNISSEERRMIKDTSMRLVGLEIVEESFSRIVLQCLLEPTASPPERILRREYNIVSSMHRDCVTAFLESDSNLAKNVIARDVEANRFYFLLVRILRAVIQNPTTRDKYGIRSIDCLDFRLCGSLVEAIGDRAAEIASKSMTLGGESLPTTIAHDIGIFHTRVFQAQEKALKGFFGHNVAVAEEVRDLKEEMRSMFHDIELQLKRQPVESVPIILAVASAIHQIYNHSLDIADLVMPKPLTKRIEESHRENF